MRKGRSTPISGPAAWLRAMLLALIVVLAAPVLALAEVPSGATGLIDPPALEASPTDVVAPTDSTLTDSAPTDPTVTGLPATPTDPTPTPPLDGATPAPGPAADPGASVPSVPTVPVTPELPPTSGPAIPSLPSLTPDIPELVPGGSLLAAAVADPVAGIGPAPPPQFASPPAAPSIARAAVADLGRPSTPAPAAAAPPSPPKSLTVPPPAMLSAFGGIGETALGGVPPPTRRISMDSTSDDSLFEYPAGFSLSPESIAPVSPAPSGSSLLSVLAGYVLPGGAGAPASTLILFIVVGLIVGLAYAGASRLGERIALFGLMGESAGHHLVVRQPG